MATLAMAPLYRLYISISRARDVKKERNRQHLCADQEFGIPGATVVVVGKDGHELFAHSAGKRGTGSKDNMDLDNIFGLHLV